MDRSEAIVAAIRTRADKLVAHDPRVMRCRVVVSMPKARGHSGHLHKVAIEISLPGEADVFVDHDNGMDHAHEDIYVAIRDAFAAARRQLAERGQRGPRVANPDLS
jgi:ribosome-associated translation inhibitor RaiA